LGFSHIFDTTFARHLALREHVQEFEERSARAKEKENAQMQLPMLASACPGWICYAEKAHSEMLPFISRTKSPQQVMGTLVKNWMGPKWGKLPQEIYHVSVMPCYDKKLEASRSDFYNSIFSTRDVDCVITTGELELLMREKGWDPTQAVPGELDDVPSPPPPSEPITHISLPELMSHPGTSSGSYLHSIISYLTSTSSTPLELSVKPIRNTDYEEYILSRRSDGFVTFKGAKCYGFRNLQNVVRKVGRERGVRVGGGAAGKLPARTPGLARRGRNAAGGEEKERGYDYVEVMACPGGCVNGGGQLKPPISLADGEERDVEGYSRVWEESGVTQNNAKWGNKEWTKRVEIAYWRDSSGGDSSKVADDLVTCILEDLCPTDEGLGDVDVREESETCRRRLFRTNYRAVESEVLGLAVKW